MNGNNYNFITLFPSIFKNLFIQNNIFFKKTYKKVRNIFYRKNLLFLIRIASIFIGE